MRILVWLFRAFIFFTLFAFALNNQQRRHRALVLRCRVACADGHRRAGRVRRRLRLRRAGDGAAAGGATGASRKRHKPRAPPAPDAAAPTGRRAVGLRARASAARRALTAAPMDFDLQWLLIGLPIAFALGWIASRFDLRQCQARQPRRAERLLQGPEPAAQRAARQGDRRLHRGGPARPRHHRAALRARQPVPPPRRVRARGARAPAPAAARRPEAGDRDRAQHALAQDFMKAGLFDRAEDAYRALDGTPLRHRGEAGAALAVRALARLAHRGRGRQPTRASRRRLVRDAHRAPLVRTGARGRRTRPPRRGRGRAAPCARGRAAAPRGRWCWPASASRVPASTRQALAVWDELRRQHPAAFRARRHATMPTARWPAARRTGRATCWAALFARAPAIDLLRALERLGAAPPLLPYLQQHPTLSAAQQWLAQPRAAWTDDGAQAVRSAIAHAARPLQRYRCAACGFEAQHYFWQCPGCLSWDSYPPQRIEEL